MDNWINVADRMPKPGEVVLSFNKIIGVNSAYYWPGTGENGFQVGIFDTMSGADGYMGIYYPQITKWQPMPTAPKE